MPGIHFETVREAITMARVLALIPFRPTGGTDVQLRGPCPIHGSRETSRVFSANLDLARFYCHRCHAHGNQLELWAAVTNQPIFNATIDLCERTRTPIPWIKRQPKPGREERHR